MSVMSKSLRKNVVKCLLICESLAELWSCVKVKADVLDSTSLIICTVSVKKKEEEEDLPAARFFCHFAMLFCLILPCCFASFCHVVLPHFAMLFCLILPCCIASFCHVVLPHFAMLFCLILPCCFASFCHVVLPHFAMLFCLILPCCFASFCLVVFASSSVCVVSLFQSVCQTCRKMCLQ